MRVHASTGSARTVLKPFALIVESLSDFTAANPTVPSAMIAGEFSGGTNLSNSGEQLTFINNTVRYLEAGDPAAKCLLVACKKVTIRNNQYIQER